MSKIEIIIGVLLGISIGLLWYYYAWVLFTVILTVIIIYYIYKTEDKNVNAFILKVFLFGYFVRIALIVLTHLLAIMGVIGVQQTLGEADGAIIGDDRFYHLYAKQIASFLRGQSETLKGEFPAVVGNYYVGSNVYFMGILYAYFGDVPLLGKVLNSLLGTLIGIIAYYIVKDCFNNIRAAKLSGLVVTFWPTLILWSVTNLKDITVFFSVLLFILIMTKINEKLMFLRVAPLLIILLYFIESIRDYTGKMLLIATMIYISMLWLSKKIRNKIIALSVIFIVTISVISNIKGIDFPVSLARSYLNYSIDIATTKHMGIVTTGGKVYKIYPEEVYYNVNIKNLDIYDLMVAYTKGVINFSLQPFPWKLDSRENLILLPQMVLWWFAIALLPVGIYYSIYNKNRKIVLILSFIFIFLSISALSEGNIGIVIRHRDMITPLVIVLASIGIFKRNDSIING